MTKSQEQPPANLGQKAVDPKRATPADTMRDLPGMAEAREAMEQARREGAPVLRANQEAQQEVRRAQTAQIAPPPAAPPALNVMHRFRASGYIFDHMMPVVVKWLEESPDRVISVAEVIENDEAWIVVTEQRELPDFYSPAHYARRERSSTK